MKSPFFSFKKPRLSGCIVGTVLLAVVVGLLAPQQLPVSAYKLSLVSMAGVIGYWLDRSLFPYARPDRLVHHTFALLFALAMIRRAIIVGCAMLAIGLGA